MKLKQMLEKWELASLKINLKLLDMEFKPNTADMDAAWEMYIELLTRVAVQQLAPEDGDEQTALSSIYSLFGITRDIIKRYKRDCIEFTKIAVVVLNQVIRPFTAEWHKASIEGAFNDPTNRDEFRVQLAILQKTLRNYTQMLADMAGVEDLTDIEAV
jgi:hypothetical protein